MFPTFSVYFPLSFCDAPETGHVGGERVHCDSVISKPCLHFRSWMGSIILPYILTLPLLLSAGRPRLAHPATTVSLRWIKPDLPPPISLSLSLSYFSQLSTSSLALASLDPYVNRCISSFGLSDVASLASYTPPARCPTGGTALKS